MLFRSSNYYVICEPASIGGAYHVYKCIDNANGSVSSVDPSSIGTPTQATTFQTGDNYKWRYITSISSQNYSNFSTENYAYTASLNDFSNNPISIGSGIAGLATGAVTGAASQVAGAAGIPVDQVLQLGGLAQNPFLTVLFKSPTFKRHSFSWKLSPNSADESNTLRDIIQTFRSNMLPALSPNVGGTLLTYPNNQGYVLIA